MTQTRTPRLDISGWLILDKPFGMTSTQAVGKVRWLLKAAKAGHAGTLDPLATGVLPIALGEATKTVPVVQEGRKTYRFSIAWGTETTTDDAEGSAVETSPERPTAEALAAILPAFTGRIVQTPPAFSAIKVAGERAYDLARAGETVVLEPREIVVDSLRLVSNGAERSELEAVCGKGTYVRALARDIARALGSRGHVAALHRAAVGPFTDATAVTLADFEAAPDPAALLLPVAAGLVGLAELRLDAAQAAAVRHGNAVLLTGAAAPITLSEAWASHAGRPLALGSVAAGQFQPSRVLR